MKERNSGFFSTTSGRPDSHSIVQTRKGNGILRLLPALVFALLLAVGIVGPAAAQEPYPPVISLPDGFRPEGIAIGCDPYFYVGSITTGAIYRGDLRNGEGDILVPAQEGRAAIGLDIDVRTGYLFVAGGPTGQAYIYDSQSGETLALLQLTSFEGTFINDVIVTHEAAYFTDSAQPILFKIPLGPDGALPNDPEVVEIPLSGDYTQVEGFNANGIAATPGDKWLVIVNTSLGTLYRVNKETGEAKLIDLNGASVPNGDGVLILGRTLYVVQNFLNQISVIEMAAGFTSGEVVRIITDEDFRIPTTIDNFGPYLYAVNARFDVAEPTTETEYEIVQVLR